MTESDDSILGVLAAAAAVMAAGYALDVAGVVIRPWLLAGVAVAAMLATLFAMPVRLRLASDAASRAPYLVLLLVLPYAYWMAAPDRLPVTNGPDVVHHLQLIHVISATGRLPHDAAQYPYLLEMMNYTPGSHILAAAIAAWFRVDPLFVVYDVAIFAAVATLVVMHQTTFRLLGSTPRAVAQGFAAPLLALVPVYFFDAFVGFFFFAQVVSQAFAMGMLLALVSWQRTSHRMYLWMASACGVGVVLSWPIWIVPSAVAACVAALLGASSWRDRIAAAGIALGPAFAFGVLHQALHRDAVSIVTSAGAVTSPSVAVFGAAFLIVSAAGMAIGVRERLARPVAALLASTLLLSGVLALLAARAGSNSFYMAFKMMYLAILPAAVLGAIALARGADLIAARRPVLAIRPRWRGVLAALLPLLVAALLVRGRVPLRRPHASLSRAAYDVGLSARARVPVDCIDYFSSYWLTGYWLHLDVLGNPRLSDRMREETFDFPDVAAKWIQGRGLPYAIVEDLRAIPREIRADMSPLHQSGSFVLVRNARPAACPPPAR